MPLKQLSPADLTTQDLEDWCSVLNDMTSSDMPGEPRWQADRLRDYLALNMVDEFRQAFLVRDDDTDEMLGHANLLLFGGNHRGTGVLELFVRPSARGKGVGRKLLHAVATCAKKQGCDDLAVEVIATTPAVGFYDQMGFKRDVVEERHLLKWSSVDWNKVHEAAGRVAAGYRLEYFSGSMPEEILEPYAELKAYLRGSAEPIALTTDRRGSTNVDRLRDSLQTLQKRGMRSHIMVAISEPYNNVVGLTELVVSAQRPTRADQYDTVVAHEHKSYGLALTMKARLLTELKNAEPQLLDVQTWTTEEARDIKWVNSQLGFVHDVDWYEYETSVDDLLQRLEAS